MINTTAWNFDFCERKEKDYGKCGEAVLQVINRVIDCMYFETLAGGNIPFFKKRPLAIGNNFSKIA